MNEKPRGELTVRISAMPADTNANGDIFGGWVLSRMDQAGGIAGVERARGRVVTIAVDAMTFIRPVRVGDVLEVFTEVESIGRTSMKIHVEAWARRFETHLQEKVTDATFTFVAIDAAGKPRPIPKEERERYCSAIAGLARPSMPWHCHASWSMPGKPGMTVRGRPRGDATPAPRRSARRARRRRPAPSAPPDSPRSRRPRGPSPRSETPR